MSNIISTIVEFVFGFFTSEVDGVKLVMTQQDEVVPAVETGPVMTKAHSTNGGMTGLVLGHGMNPTLLQYLQGWSFVAEEADLVGIIDSPELRETIRMRGWIEELNDRVVSMGIFVTGYEWEPVTVGLLIPKFWEMPHADFVASLKTAYPYPAIAPRKEMSN